jgi:hypothetical protein
MMLAQVLLLAGAVCAGEILTLDAGSEGRIPLSYAAMIVAIAALDPAPALAAVLVGELAALVVQRDLRVSRLLRVVARLAVFGAALGAVLLVRRIFGDDGHLPVVVGALAAGCVAELLAHLATSTVRSPILGARAALGWLALASSAILMGVGIAGAGGHDGVGLIGTALLAVPLLTAWYGFDLYQSASRTYRQTIEALALTPELAGLAADGHAQRVAELAERIALRLDVSAEDRQHLEQAALLHHFGVVTLDDPEVTGEPHVPALVAHVTAAALDEIPRLAPAAAIVRGGVLPNRFTHDAVARSSLLSRILRVASDFDDLCGGDDARASGALEALYAAPGYMYDPGVLESLEQVLIERALVPSPTA